jgi:creatinine amidohydrolase
MPNRGAPFMLPSHYWNELSTEDMRRLPMGETVAVLPLAAIEQHGPHLPLGTDVAIMRGYLSRALEMLPPDAPILILPIQPVGLSPEHQAFPGTLTLSPETVLRVWREIGESVHRSGCRKLVLLSSHGGNNAAMEIVARDLRVSLGMLVVTTSWSRLGYPPETFAAEELRHGIHAGDVETSLMLDFRPDLVRRENLAAFENRAIAMERDYVVLRPDKPAGFGWMTQDLNPSGALGDATAATREKGAAAANHGASAFAALIQDVLRFDLKP